MNRTNAFFLQVIFVLIVLFIGYRIYLSTALKTKLNEIHKAGYPVTPEELNKWYKEPPNGQNAADLFQQAFKKYFTDTNRFAQVPAIGTKTKLPANNKPLPFEMMRDSEAFLKANSEAIQLLRKASSSMDQCRFPIDTSQGFSTLLLHLAPLRHGARIFSLKACVETDKGQTDLAVQSTIDTLHLGKFLEKEPMLISQLVQIACEAISLQSLERLLNRSQLTEEQIDRLNTELMKPDKPGRMTAAFVGELCMVDEINSGRIVEARISNIFKQPDKLGFFLGLYKFVGLQDLDLLTLIDLQSDAIELSKEPLAHERFRQAMNLEDKQAKVPRFFIYTRLLSQIFCDSMSREIRVLAHLREARIALEIERYRLEHKQLPDKLSDLAPKYLNVLPSDPFNGQPLHYKKLEKGYLIYSVGDDLKDNGGNDSAIHSIEPDVTFRVER